MNSDNTAVIQISVTEWLKQFMQRLYHPWVIGYFFLCGLIILPLLAIIYLALFPDQSPWAHLFSTVLPYYFYTTVKLLLGVGILSSCIGIGGAWITARYKFSGVKWLSILLLLPLAMPAYIIAYVYTDILDYSGWIQTSLRALFGWQSRQDYWFFSIRSLGGAIVMLSFVLYPYVYLLARAAFLSQSQQLDDAAQILGLSRWQRFIRISLPSAREPIAIGLMLVLMETLNDFGTVSYFAVHTLNYALWDSWNQNDLGSAAQIALFILGISILLIYLEKRSRIKQRYYQKNQKHTIEPIQLMGWKNILAIIICLLPVILGFILPASVLTYYSWQYYELSLKANVLTHAFNSFLLAGVAAILTGIFGIFLAYGQRLNIGGKWGKYFSALACFGYAFPGAVLAVGIIVPLAYIDNRIDIFFETHFGYRTGLILTGGVFTIIYAYAVRFLVIARGSVQSSLNRVTPSMDMAARSLGLNALATLRYVHFPLISKGIMVGMLLVFVDCMKELPATLILRPFGLETLATFVYQYTSDELLRESATAALLIVLTGLIPLILLSRAIDNPPAT